MTIDRRATMLLLIAGIMTAPAFAEDAEAQKAPRPPEQTKTEIDRTITGSTPPTSEAERPTNTYPPAPSSIGGNIFF